MDTTTSQPKTKYKSFAYRTGVRWTGDRNGLLTSDGKPDIPVSSPPEFKGKAGQWTPEDLLVASVEICTMTTFIAFSLHKKLPLVSYESAATGSMEFSDGRYRFTSVTLKPRIVVGTEGALTLAASVLEEAHKSCFIANSICSRVIIEPTIICTPPCSSDTQTVPPDR